MVHHLILFTCIFISLSIQSQPTWQKTYGGFDVERPGAIKALADGGALICGSTGSFGDGGSIYLLRLDVLGNIIWSNYVGGSGVEVGWDLVVMPDESFFAIGTTNSIGSGDYDGLVVYVSSDGEIQWQQAYGTASWDLFYAGDLADDGLVLTGTTYGHGDGNSQMWIVMIDFEGNLVWETTYGISLQAESRDVTWIEGDGCAIIGTTGIGSLDPQMTIVKLDLAGNFGWDVHLGGGNEERGYGITLLSGGEIAGVGSTSSFGTSKRMFMSKVSSDGEMIWSMPVSSGGADWEARDIFEQEDGTFVVAGYTEEFGAGGKDFSMLFLDQLGFFFFGPTYGGLEDDEAWSVDRSNDGRYYIVGSTNSFGPGIESILVVRSHGDTLNAPVQAVFDPVNVGEFYSDIAPTVYPQPLTTPGVISVMSDNSQKVAVNLRNAYGQIITMVEMHNGHIMLPSLPPGSYILEVLDVMPYRIRILLS